MTQHAWRSEVASLFEHCAEMLRARQDRQVAAAFGTALAYLVRAEDAGDRGATAVLSQVQRLRCEENTKRFSFAPGELEELTGGRLTK
jgi:hypothetical protein